MDSGNLSVTFLNKMRELLGGEYEAYLASFTEEPVSGLRVNTLKVTPELFAAKAQEAGWELWPVSWVSNGFYYGKELRPARHPWYYAGLYYLQEPSAMTPASLLPVAPGEKVLDLCAAPGGKSTELAARLCGQGLLFANDISNSRAKALLKNLELFGVSNLCVSSETPEKLCGLLEGFFDKILVDAPCSGEGMFRRDPDMRKSYEEHGPEYYIPIQRQIVTSAVRMLAPGGMLLYSTCTFDREENEGTIRYLLEHFPELRLVNLEKKDGFEPGIGMPECVRLFPHRIRGEGHFIALLQKGETESGGLAERSHTRLRSDVLHPGGKAASILPGSVYEFLKEISREWDPARFHMVKESVYYLPEAFAGTAKGRLKGIRCLRTGLLLGEVKKDRFEPSQALAMCLKAGEYKTVLNLSAEDDRVIRYLKGETLQLTEEESEKIGKSWCLICVEHQPLGWGKKQNQTIKNKYYPGWRWQ